MPADEVRGALREYYAALNNAVHGPAMNVDRLEHAIDPACTCRAILSALRAEAARGRHVDYSYVVRDVRVIDVRDVGADVTFVLVQTAGSERDARGAVVHRYPGGTRRMSATFVRRDGRWLLSRLVTNR